MKSIIPVLCAMLLIGCGKKTAVVEKPMPTVTPTPRVYKLGEPRPIVLNVDKPEAGPATRPVTTYHENTRRRPSHSVPQVTETAANDSQHKAMIAKLQRDADASKQAQKNSDAQQRSAWRTESQDAAWKARYGTDRPPADWKGFRPTISEGK